MQIDARSIQSTHTIGDLLQMASTQTDGAEEKMLQWLEVAKQTREEKRDRESEPPEEGEDGAVEMVGVNDQNRAFVALGCEPDPDETGNEVVYRDAPEPVYVNSLESLAAQLECPPGQPRCQRPRILLKT